MHKNTPVSINKLKKKKIFDQVHGDGKISWDVVN